MHVFISSGLLVDETIVNVKFNIITRHFNFRAQHAKFVSHAAVSGRRGHIDSYSDSL